MSTHIDIKGSASRFDSKVRAVIDATRRLKDAHGEVIDVMAEISAGGTDFASLATALGTSEVDAQTVYTLLRAMRNDVKTPDIMAVISRLG